MTRLAIVDYGCGNLRSVQKAFEKAGAATIVSGDPEVLEAAPALVLPGVGAFGDAIGLIRQRGLFDPLRRWALEDGKPLLGICLGMQLLCGSSEEDGSHEGLGLIPDSVVRRLDVDGKRDWAGRKLPLPHMGWSSVTPVAGSRLFDGIAAGADFYFVHSYHVVCPAPSVAATAWYGDDFTCAVQHGRVFGAQFHPEKSQRDGARLIANFVRACAELQEG